LWFDQEFVGGVGGRRGKRYALRSHDRTPSDPKAVHARPRPPTPLLTHTCETFNGDSIQKETHRTAVVGCVVRLPLGLLKAYLTTSWLPVFFDFISAADTHSLVGI
jgi:hypothetical protein